MKRFLSSRPPLALVSVLVLVGFLLVTTGTATDAASRSAEPRRQELINQILAQQQNVDDLDQAVAQVQGDVNEADLAAGEASTAAANRNAKTRALALEAGTLAVEGNGLTVEVSDAPNRTGNAFDSTRIQDNDLQLLVNALFAAGAEAIAINDNRVVAVTPIRAAGGTIVVNYRPVNSPYRIVAIGADKDEFEASEIASRFSQWKDRYQLGYSVNESRKLSAPAYSGRVGITLAQPDTSTTTAPTSTSTEATR